MRLRVMALCVALLIPALGLSLRAHGLDAPTTAVTPEDLALAQLYPGQGSALETDIPPFHFSQVSGEQGYSGSETWSVLRDQRGFMWFGTMDGLERYDGYRLEAFTNLLHDPTSLSDNKIRTLYEDRAGTLWIGTWTGGLNRYDRLSETFARFQHDPADPDSLSNDSVFAILEDRAGNLWLGTRGGGLNRFDPDTGKFSHYRHDPVQPTSLANDNVFALSEDENGALWVGTDGGLDRLDPASGAFTHFRHDPNDPTSPSNDTVRALLRDQSGALWVGTWGGGLDRYDRLNNTFSHFQHDPDNPRTLSNDAVFSIAQDMTGALWLGTYGGGLNRLDPLAETFQRWSQNDEESGAFSATNVFDITVYDDMAWFATGAGVFALDIDPKPFYAFRHTPNETNSLASNETGAVYEDSQGILWVATASTGLNRIDRVTGQVDHYQNEPSDPDSIGSNSIWSIEPAQDGALWLATYGSGLDKFDPVTGKAIHYRHNPNNPTSLVSDLVTYVLDDGSGSVWVGTWDAGLDRLDPATGVFSHYAHDPARSESLSDNGILMIAKDVAGRLWIGTVAGGLNRLDEATGRFTHYRGVPENPQGLPADSVDWVHFDDQGTVWVATWGGGLARLDPDTGIAVHYDRENGLPSDAVHAIIEDDAGYLWLSTGRGLSRFDPRTETFRNYSVQDGLPSEVFESTSAHRSPSGEIFLGTADGLLAFYPEQIRDNLTVPPVVITDLLLDNKPVPIAADSPVRQAIEETRSVVLTYDDRVIGVEFAALGYSNPQKNRYRYMLEGFDEGWTEVGSNRRLVTYTNLDPGDYVFRVLGSNDDGIWNKLGASLALTITPPWWQTAWFRAVVVLMIGGVIAGSFAWQRRNAMRHQRKLEALVTARTRELHDARMQIRTLFDSSPLGICLATNEDRIIGTNRAMLAMTGFEEVDLLEKRVQALYAHPEERDAVVARLSQTGAVSNYGIQMRRRDGTTFFASLNLSRLRLADQEAILVVVDNVTDQVKAHAALATLNQISYDLASSTDLRSLTQHGLQNLARVVDYDGAALVLLEEDGETATILAYHSPSQPPVTTLNHMPIRRWPSLQTAIMASETVYVPDIRASAAIQSEMESVNSADWTAALKESRSLLALPLPVGERTIGLLGILHSKVNYYGASDIELARTFSNQLAVAIDNIRLNDQARRTAAADERSRIARELHDSVTQTLFTASVLAEATPRIWHREQDIARQNMEKLSVLIRGALAEMRSLLLELRSSTSPDQSLDQLLNTLAEAARARSNMTVSLVTRCDRALPVEVTMSFYRIAQEALNNVIRHAHATRVDIVMLDQTEYVELRIQDDGRGFDPKTVGNEHMGISIISERAEKMGGRLHIQSQIGRGTEISLVWNYPASELDHE